MRKWWNLALTQARLYLREPAAFFFTLVFPPMMLILFGVIFGNEPDPTFSPDYGYVDYEVPAIAGLIIGTVAFMGVPVSVASAREHKVLRRFQATPITAWTYLLAEVAVNLGMSLVSMILLIVAGRVFFDLRLPASLPAVTLAFLFAALAFIATGLAVAGLSPTARVAQTVGMVLYFPMLFLSGATIPREIMPEGVRRIGDFLPMTHVVELLQGLWFGEAWQAHGLETAVLAAMLALGGIVGARTFRWE